MLYLLQVYALFAVPVFAITGLIILFLAVFGAVFGQLKAYADARRKIQLRLPSPVKQPHVFARIFAIPRTVSRITGGAHLTPHKNH